MRSRLVAMEVAHGVRFDTFAGTAPLKCIKIIISRAASIKNVRGRHSRVLAFFDICVAFKHTQLPEDEPIANVEEEAGYMWQMKRAMFGTRPATRLFQEHMKGVLKEAGYAALKVCHQVYHCLETDTMAAIHGDDIIAEGEPDKLDRLDEVLKRLVVVKVLDRIGPGAAEHWTAPEETHRVHRQTGIRVAGRCGTSCCDHQKPFQDQLPGQQGPREKRSRSVGRVGRGGSKAVSAEYRHQHLRVQW